MFTFNLVGVFGAMVAALLAWIPVLGFGGGPEEFGAVFVFVASIYASLTDRHRIGVSAKASEEFPKRPDSQVAIFGAPLLLLPFIAVPVIFGYLCFHHFERAGYVLALYVGGCAIAFAFAVVTARWRLARALG